MKRFLLVAGALLLAVGIVVVWSRPLRGKPQPPAVSASPFRVQFVPGGRGPLGEPILVDLVLEAEPEHGSAQLSGEGRLELLLRLPSGVALRSEGWKPVELPPEKAKDPTGKWSLFEQKKPISIPSGISKELARESVKLAVVEKGINWIITARARIVQGSKIWQTFGVVFATVQKDGQVEFHAAPRMSEMEQRAQAD